MNEYPGIRNTSEFSVIISIAEMLAVSPTNVTLAAFFGIRKMKHTKKVKQSSGILSPLTSFYFAFFYREGVHMHQQHIIIIIIF